MSMATRELLPLLAARCMCDGISFQVQLEIACASATIPVMQPLLVIVSITQMKHRLHFHQVSLKGHVVGAHAGA